MKKKCPHCKADIEENARFCLYCMTSLDEKQAVKPPHHNHTTRWLALLAAFLVLALAASSVWFGLGRSLPVGTADEGPQSTERTEPAAGSTQSRPQIAAGGTSTGSVPGSTGTQTPDSSVTNPPLSVTSPPVSSVSYTYRQAQEGDDYWLRYYSENEIVITGVCTASENGEYIIPEQIDGKTVVAVMQRAFTDEAICDTVRKVVVPATVKTIWDYAFSTCYNLTDIYFCGDAIYTSPQAFAWESRRTGTLTIHCSADCSDRNFRYYKDCAGGSYDAIYEECNG